MPSWSPSHGFRWWIRIEAAPGTQAHQNPYLLFGQGHTQLHWLIASIEREDGAWLLCSTLAQERADLFGGDLIVILSW
jgi:hypothetical protein